MVMSNEHTRSFAHFLQSPDETLSRIDQEGSAEVLTINGEPRAIVISPAAYAEFKQAAMLAAEDDAAISLSIQQFKNGEGIPLEKAFADMRTRFVARQIPAEDSAK